MERRCVICGILGLGIASVTPLAAPKAVPRPFCRYSLDDGWTDTGPQEYITRQAHANDPSGVPQVVHRIKQSLSASVDFDIFLAEREDNAFAAVANGRRILVVDVGFLERLNQIVRTEWGAIQVIAHEVGHHIAGFSDNRHRSELNADYWSGQALKRLGSSKDAATRAILTVGTEVDTPTHPNKHTRAATIRRGWDDAARQHIDYSFCNDCR